MIFRSLTARVVVGALLVVSAVLVGGGLTIVTVTEQRDKRDADAELRRFAGNLTPSVAGALGVAPRPPPSPPPEPAPGSRPGACCWIANGKPIHAAARSAAADSAAPNSPQPGVVQALVDAFSQRGESSGPAGQIVFVRALAVRVRPPADLRPYGGTADRLSKVRSAPTARTACGWVRRAEGDVLGGRRHHHTEGSADHGEGSQLGRT